MGSFYGRDKTSVFLVVCIVCLAMIWFLYTGKDEPKVDAASSPVQMAAPGTVDDPVVTKSYVDEIATKLQNGASSALQTTSLKLEKGQTLMAKAGAQILVRTGKALIVSTDKNGVPDATGGQDLAANVQIPLNHLLLFPRDGRGIKADQTDTKDVWIMVTGEYTLNPSSK